MTCPRFWSRFSEAQKIGDFWFFKFGISKTPKWQFPQFNSKLHFWFKSDTEIIKLMDLLDSVHLKVTLNNYGLKVQSLGFIHPLRRLTPDRLGPLDSYPNAIWNGSHFLETITFISKTNIYCLNYNIEVKKWIVILVNTSVHMFGIFIN